MEVMRCGLNKEWILDPKGNGFVVWLWFPGGGRLCDVIDTLGKEIGCHLSCCLRVVDHSRDRVHT